MATRRSKKAQQQQQQLLIIGGGALAAIIVAAVAIFFISQNADVEVCDANDEECYGAYLGEVDTGFTEEGFGFIGSAEAPIYVAEVADFACPHCVDYHPTYTRLIREYAKTGQARFVFMSVNWTGGNNSTVATQVMYCAGEQGAYWQMHDEIFELSENQGANALDRETLLGMAGDMGLDTGDMESCMNNNRSRRSVTEAVNLAQRFGVSATPTVMVSYDGGVTWQSLGSREYSTVVAAIAAAQPAPAES